MIWNAFSLGVIFLLLALGLWLWRQSTRLEARTGLPTGTVIYTDSGAWFPNEESLYARDVRLVGKPDYLVEQPDGMIVPVEVKSAFAPDEPWDGHILQLAAYCLLVEEQYGVRPAYGILQYRDRAFAIDYTDELEDTLLDVLLAMREDGYRQTVDRDHDEWQRCAGCGVRAACDQRLD